MRMIWDSAADAKVWLSSMFNDGWLSSSTSCLPP
jgi:hypothetical protein